MSTESMFAPSLAGYVSYCLGFFARYFLLAGSIYLILHLLWRERFRRYRIQPAFPHATQSLREIAWTGLNTLCSGVSSVLLYWLIAEGATRMYFDVGDRGWPYFLGSMIVGVVGYDAWFYWQHRLLHHAWLFERVHSVHHRSSNPTVFAAYAHHPVETFMGNAYFVLFPLIVPVHPVAFAGFGGALLLVSLAAHCGYEFFPPGFTRHRLTRWLGTSTHHNLHHSQADCNYGIVLNVWDRVMGTNLPDYDRVFDAVSGRPAGTVGVSA